jgi:hypothetical protein
MCRYLTLLVERDKHSWRCDQQGTDEIEGRKLSLLLLMPTNWQDAQRARWWTLGMCCSRWQSLRRAWCFHWKHGEVQTTSQLAIWIRWNHKLSYVKKFPMAWRKALTTTTLPIANAFRYIMLLEIKVYTTFISFLTIVVYLFKYYSNVFIH